MTGAATLFYLLLATVQNALISRAYVLQTRPLVTRLDNSFHPQRLLSHTIKFVAKENQHVWQKNSHFEFQIADFLLDSGQRYQ